MLDWFSSKIAMIIAISILTIAVVGFFNNEISSFNSLELKNIADEISNAINNVANVKAEIQLRVTFSENVNGTYIRPTVRGETYSINLTQDSVTLRYKEFTVTNKVISRIHLWNVSLLNSSKNLSSSRVQEYDSANSSNQFLSGTDFIILNKQINVDGNEVYLTFVCLNA